MMVYPIEVLPLPKSEPSSGSIPQNLQVPSNPDLATLAKQVEEVTAMVLLSRLASLVMGDWRKEGVHSHRDICQAGSRSVERNKCREKQQGGHRRMTSSLGSYIYPAGIKLKLMRKVKAHLPVSLSYNYNCTRR